MMKNILALGLFAIVGLLDVKAGDPVETKMKFRVILFTASDIEPVPADIARIRDYVLYAEDFYNRGVRKWGHEPGQVLKAERDAAGLPEIFTIQGTQTKSSGAYVKPNFAEEVKQLVEGKYGVKKGGDLWWVFRLNPPNGWGLGGGSSVFGGLAWAAHFRQPSGEIVPGADLAGGILRELKFKACIHELGHGFGLPHIGPSDNIPGNSLMGPVNKAFAARVADEKQHPLVYLTEASAAMLSVHPLFTGDEAERRKRTRVRLGSMEVDYQAETKMIRVHGKVSSSIAAKYIVVANVSKKTRSDYWRKFYTAKIAEDGSFSVDVKHSDGSLKGELQAAFIFANGVVSGTGLRPGFNASAIKKRYQFGADGEFELVVEE